MENWEQEALPGFSVPPSGHDKLPLLKCSALHLTNLSGCPFLDISFVYPFLRVCRLFVLLWSPASVCHSLYMPVYPHTSCWRARLPHLSASPTHPPRQPLCGRRASCAQRGAARPSPSPASPHLRNDPGRSAAEAPEPQRSASKAREARRHLGRQSGRPWSGWPGGAAAGQGRAGPGKPSSPRLGIAGSWWARHGPASSATPRPCALSRQRRSGAPPATSEPELERSSIRAGTGAGARAKARSRAVAEAGSGTAAHGAEPGSQAE